MVQGNGLPPPPPLSATGARLLTLLRSISGTPPGTTCQACAVGSLRLLADDFSKACRELILYGLGRGAYEPCSMCGRRAVVVGLRREPFGLDIPRSS